MSSLIARRVLLALAAVGVLAGAIGACGSENAGNYGDGGGGSDFGGNGDGGASGDLGTLQEIKVSLLAPAPWQSMVATSAQFQFLATIPGGGTPQMLEPYVQVVPRVMGGPDGGGMALSGAFNWKSTGPAAYQLDFLPAALADNTDFVVTVANPTNLFGPPLLKTGISTGSNPRVVRVQFKVTAHANAVSALVTFSEPMDPTSLVSKLVVTAGGSAVAGTVSEPSGATDHLRFQLDVGSPHSMAYPILVTVKAGAMAMSLMPVNPQSWDSATKDVNGNFYWQPTTTTSLDALTSDTSYEFMPTVN